MPGADITPVVLTHDEEDNLGRTLESLGWAKTVLVMDSGSTDRTRSIAEAHANVTFVVRPFKGHGDQWDAAVRHPAVTTRYVLALDADMSPERGLVNEMDTRVVGLASKAAWSGFSIAWAGPTCWERSIPPSYECSDAMPYAWVKRDTRTPSRSRSRLCAFGTA